MRNERLAIAVAWLTASTVLAGACAPYGDGAYAQRQHRIESERRAADMRQATAQQPRGQDLGAAALGALLPGSTWTQRYQSFPNGKRGDHVVYRHFAADGQLLVVDNWLQPSGSGATGDWWRVEPDGRLCTLHQYFSSTPRCYRLARTREGALQVYIDDPGSPYNELLTLLIRDIGKGPPPHTDSVLRSPQ